MKPIRIGADLHERLLSLSDKFGRKVNAIARMALRSWEKGGCRKLDAATFSTQRDGGTVLQLDTDLDAAEVRAIIADYIEPYEAMEVKPPKLSDAVMRDIKALNEQNKNLARLEREAQIEVLTKEMEVAK